MSERKAEVERAHKARMVLENPVYQEAWQFCEDNLLAHITSDETSDEQVLEARKTLKVLKNVKKHLNTIIDTGKMAEIQLASEDK